MHVAFLRAAGLKEKLAYLQGRAETARSLAVRGVFALYERLIRPVREALFDPHQRARRRVLATNFRAAARYVPGHYEGRVTIFRATDRPDGFRDRLQPYPLLGWEELCAGVELIEVLGGHSSLMEEEAQRPRARSSTRRAPARRSGDGIRRSPDLLRLAGGTSATEGDAGPANRAGAHDRRAQMGIGIVTLAMRDAACLQALAATLSECLNAAQTSRGVVPLSAASGS